jgi:hypothetical protein
VGAVSGLLELALPLGESATSPAGAEEAMPRLPVAHAEPGMLLCSEATARLIRAEVRLEAHQPVPVPGQPTPLLAYHVIGVYPRDVAVVRRIGRAESPFVWRTQALVTLHTLLAQVEAGHGQAVGIVGEPGIGKSRLLAEFYRSLRGRQLQYLHRHCLSYGQATP